MNPLLGMLSQSSGALSGGSPSFGQSMMQGLQQSNLGGYGAGGALGAILPAMMQGGVLGQGGQSSPSYFASGAASGASSDNSQWQALVSMLMQKLGIGGGGAEGNTFSGGNPNSGFLPSYNIAGIYSR